jgi:hypothetical protein
VIDERNEDELSRQSFRCQVGVSPQPSASPAQTRKAAYPLHVRHIRRDLLRSARLPARDATCQLTFRASQTVYYHFRRLCDPQGDLDTLAASASHGRARTARKKPASQRSHSGRGLRVKTVAGSAGMCGFDTHKHVRCRLRPLLVDLLEIPLSIYVTEADMHDIRGAHCLLAGLKYFVPRLTKNWGRRREPSDRSWLTDAK